MRVNGYQKPVAPASTASARKNSQRAQLRGTSAMAMTTAIDRPGIFRIASRGRQSAGLISTMEHAENNLNKGLSSPAPVLHHGPRRFQTKITCV